MKNDLKKSKTKSIKDLQGESIPKSFQQLEFEWWNNDENIVGYSLKNFRNAGRSYKWRSKHPRRMDAKQC